jgi:hypothetical protein
MNSGLKSRADLSVSREQIMDHSPQKPEDSE